MTPPPVARRQLPEPPRPDRHVLLRPDRLPAHPRRQRAAVRRLDVAPALAPGARLRRDARREHHRHQRQDLRGRPGAAPSSPPTRARWYIEDTDLLGLGPPRPRAAGDRDDPGDRRADRGADRALDLAYEAGGDVYFRVDRFPDYGRLSGRHDDESAMRNPSEEEEQSALKENPRDFALWKAHKEGEDTWWDSPWGPGRPGWHIECSAMAEKHLGPGFEIHGGGLDLVFPHHENEIAQSRGAGREFARIWMHNGMLRLGGEKMSKSLGNLVTLRDAVEEWGRETLLMLFLGAHWRKPMDYSDETLAAAKARAEGFREVFRNPSSRPAVVGRASGGARGRLQHAGGARGHARVARPRPPAQGARPVRARLARRAGEAAPPSWTSSRGDARTTRAAATSTRPTACAAEIEAAGWEVRDVAGDPVTSSSRSGDAPSRSTAGARFARRCAGRARCSSCGRPSAPEGRAVAARERPGRACRSSPSAS